VCVCCVCVCCVCVCCVCVCIVFALCLLCVCFVFALCLLCVCFVFALCLLCVCSVFALCLLCVCSVRVGKHSYHSCLTTCGETQKPHPLALVKLIISHNICRGVKQDCGGTLSPILARGVCQGFCTPRTP
jgi:hypothetical protein